jgi:hypothetical protein
MPNRMLRDWTDSEKVNSLSPQEERMFLRLIMKADDYGCYYADTRLLRASLFPLLIDTVREADISRWMAACQKAGLIVLYEVANKRYLQIVDFKQRLDKARAKYPLPNENHAVDVFPEFVNEFPGEVETEVEVEPELEKKLKEKKATKVDRPPPKKKAIQHLFSESIIFDSAEFEKAISGTVYQEANIGYYWEIIKNWSDSKNAKKADWLATAKNWMARDMTEGKFIKKNFKPSENGRGYSKGKQSTGADVSTSSILSKIASMPD